MTMYRMIAIDMDDTLLTDDLTITPGTSDAIKQAIEAGVVVTLATGRMFPSALPFASQLELNVPLVTYQGAIVKDTKGETVMYERLVTPDISRRVIDIARTKNIHLQVYQDDILYSPEDNDKIRQYVKIAGVPYTVESDLHRLAERDCIKLLYFDEPKVLDELAEELRAEFGETAHITKSKPYFLEVMHPEANKGSAVLHFAKTLGIDRSEIIGIGDSYNDLDLIETAGLGVAMGNAPEAIKQIADYITFSNNEEGVRHVIEKFVLQKESNIKC
ncbi:Cof-type HAD-IIB family hydrolase [Aneurinibacillus aneurinilyticus]|jgi:Cof subfamily protein (haloacid dehalogenase superfamily)|uniref:Cof-like hydrolase n=2 Tax=Aneurinibacillus aneurinilyticus TaxID=1391 RepID=U1WMR4_ANEAE|nr:Cof-type HAD-IIB family hydrolase [Aneurinibacillus aneurinilyticus]ERI03925.1 Cof-like hydrolase [Aneurinibacillus aneurinilyticus ATCC 12856]